MALCFSLRYEWFLMIARIAVIAPPMLLVLAALSTAQAAEPTGTLTLACQGTMGKSAVSPDTEREPVSKVVIFNFTAKTITLVEGASTSGFTYPIKINEANELAIKFGIPDESKASEFVWGTIGRVTGDMEVYYKHPFGLTYYSLKCKPAQRMF